MRFYLGSNYLMNGRPQPLTYHSTSCSNFAKHTKALNHGLQILHVKGCFALSHCFLKFIRSRIRKPYWSLSRNDL
nr:hypothetical protein Iba_scaffold35504CG0040 [Ipomoea batatas]